MPSEGCLWEGNHHLMSPTSCAHSAAGLAVAGGFIPKREEFEYEWDNECESSIGDMEFGADDTPEDVQLKLKVCRPAGGTLGFASLYSIFQRTHRESWDLLSVCSLQVLAIYNYKLDERDRRKRYILERGLLRAKQHNTKQHWSKEEKEIHKKVDIFSR